MDLGRHHDPAKRKVFYLASKNGIRSSMNVRGVVGTFIGAFVVFLGLVWFLQGTGILRMRPILCIANCEEVVGPSLTWAVAGAVAFIIGIVVVAVSVRRANV
jgi:hypothetical protein